MPLLFYPLHVVPRLMSTGPGYECISHRVQRRSLITICIMINVSLVSFLLFLRGGRAAIEPLASCTVGKFYTPRPFLLS